MPAPASGKPGSLAPLVVGLGIGAVVVATAVIIMRHEQPVRANRTNRPAASAPAPFAPAKPKLSPAAYRIATQFACTCGACGGSPLESCDCPTAVKERAFIESQLAAGLAETQVAEALQAKYGGRKKPADGTAAVPPTEVQRTAPRVATAADRAHIISHFKCPCNQCAIDELRDCECPHTNGAQEVKQFIDDTIAQGQHTVGEIVALVEQRYGGRIR